MIKKIFNVGLIIAIVTVTFIPNRASAITLGEYEATVEQYKKEIAEFQNSIKLTQEEKNKINSEIERLRNETNSLVEESKKINDEIIEYNGKIKDKLMQSKQIIEYMQLSSGENVYLEYVFKADSTSDLIYRAAVVKELVDYNNKVIDEMKQLISDNEDRQKEIDKREIEIEKKQKELNENLTKLGQTENKYGSQIITKESEMKVYEDKVKAYKDLGCESDDVIGVDCAIDGDAGAFRRPTETGYITQEAVYTPGYVHRGIDIGSSNGRSEKVYAVADGRVAFIGHDGYGALVVAVEHYVAEEKKWYTSAYAHLSAYAPGLQKGQTVTSNDYLGYMGDTGYAFGVHLHLEIFPCRMAFPTDTNCGGSSPLGNFLNFGLEMMRNGFEGPRHFIYFPSRWYSR